MGAGGATALPTGPTVAGKTTPGNATFDFSVAQALTVNQTARRVVIDWRSFDISSGETVTFRQSAADWIAFNRIAAPSTTIDGALNATGGVWLFTPGGLVIGANARVNVGSFVAATGLTDPTNLNQFLKQDPTQPGLYTTTIQGSPGAGVESLTVQSGAEINAANGFVVLQSETLVQDGAVTAADGVSYLAAQTGSITYTGNASGQQLRSVSAVPIAGQDRPSFSHGGSTSAAWVGVDAPGGALEPGYRGVINLDGVIQATGIKPGSGNGGVVLLAGGDLGPAEPGYDGASIGVDASGASITATNALVVRSDSAILGDATLGGPLDVATYGDITLAGSIATTSYALLKSLGPAGTLHFGGDLRSDKLVSGAAQTITVGPGALVSSDAKGHGSGDVLLVAVGNLNADPTSQLLGGNDPAAPTANIRVSAGQVGAGGNLVSGPMAGKDVRLIAYGAAGQGGDITIAGKIYGAASVVLRGNQGDHGLAPGVVRVLAPVSSDGLIDLQQQGAGDIVIDADMTARLDLTASAQTIRIGPSVTLRADSQGLGASQLRMTAQANYFADPSSMLVGGPDPAAPTADVLVSAGRGGKGGTLIAGGVAGSDVTVYDYSDPLGHTNFVIGGTIHGAHSVIIQDLASDIGQGIIDIRVSADVTSAGTISISGQGVGDLAIDPGTRIVGGDDVYLATGHDMTLAGSVSGKALAAVAQGTLHLASTGSLSTTGSTSAPAWPQIPQNLVQAAGSTPQTPALSGLTLEAGALDIQGTVAAGTANDIFIQPLGAPTEVVVGGASGAGGFQLSNADVGHLSGRNLVVLGGPGEGQGAGFDVRVEDLSLDSSKITGLWLGAPSDKTVTVAGTVTASGGVAVNIGFVRTAASSSDLDGFIPGEIDITGGLGATGSSLGSVALIARNDILMGSSGFISAARSDPNFDAEAGSRTSSSAGVDHVFVASHALQLAALGRVIQQNTARSSLRYAGLEIDTPTAGKPLISAVTALSGKMIGGSGGWSAAFSAGPHQVDVFGSLAQADGTSVSDVRAALQTDLVETPIVAIAAYQINGCAFGATCAPVDPPPFIPPLIGGGGGGGLGGGPGAAADAASQSSGGDMFSLSTMTVQPSDDDRFLSDVPVTESGNNDLWTGIGESQRP